MTGSRYDVWRTAAPEDDEGAALDRAIDFALGKAPDYMAPDAPPLAPGDPDPALVALVDAARPFAAWWRETDPGAPVPDVAQWRALADAVSAYDDPKQAHTQEHDHDAR